MSRKGLELLRRLYFRWPVRDRTVLTSRTLSLTYLTVVTIQINRPRAAVGVFEGVVLLGRPVAEGKIVRDDARTGFHLLCQDRPQLQVRCGQQKRRHDRRLADVRLHR